jgi:hypothetical protein
LLGSLSASSASADLARFGPAEFACVSAKQKTAARYCHSALRAWSRWDRRPDDARLERDLLKAGEKLAQSFERAEQISAEQGVDCIDQTVTVGALGDSIDAVVATVVDAVNSGLDLAESAEARCGQNLLEASARLCKELLENEALRTAGFDDQHHPKGKKHHHHAKSSKMGAHDADLEPDEHFDVHRQLALDGFDERWERADCATEATQRDVKTG